MLAEILSTLEADACASARRARAFQSASPPVPLRPSHFSVRRMLASIQFSWSAISSSEW
jgi:hypothetical protein